MANNSIQRFLLIITILNQQIQIQSSIPNQIIGLLNNSYQQDQIPDQMIKAYTITNSINEKDQNTQNNNTESSSIYIKSKYKILQELYNQGLEKLKIIKNQKDTAQKDQKEKKQIKIALQAKLKQFSSKSQTKSRKGSQTSTAGQDEDIKSRFQTNKGQQQYHNENQIISALQKKLQLIRTNNQQKDHQQITHIQKLKNQINKDEKGKKIIESSLEINQGNQKSMRIQQTEQLQIKIFKQKVIEISKTNQKLTNNILQIKKSTQSFQDNIQYLNSRQNCCLQILDQELCTIKYKIQGRRIQYDSNKRYLDRITRNRKNQQNVSFQDIKNQIDYLNDYCSQMMAKKNEYFNPQIKKFKQKRFIIMEEIKLCKEKTVSFQENKKQVENKIKQQNLQHDLLQDEYFSILQKLDNQNHTGRKNISPEQQITLLRDKKTALTEEIKQITKNYESIKLSIENNHNLIPQSLVKQFQKKIKKIKEDIKDVEFYTKQNAKLSKENEILNEQKQKLQWKSNPELEKLIKEQKNLIKKINQSSEQIKILKKRDQTLQQKISEYKQIETSIQLEKLLIETQKQKKQRQILQRQEQQRKRKQQEQQIKQNRQKLMEKFRQAKEKQQRERQQEKQRQKQKKRDSEKEIKKIKGKKGKSSSISQKNQIIKIQAGLDDPKLRSFFGRRENPLDLLRSDFPSNRSQEVPPNSSLLMSNPALWMFIFYLTVIVPGLCIGYCI